MLKKCNLLIVGALVLAFCNGVYAKQTMKPFIWKVGFAKVDITPSDKVWMGGFTRKTLSTGIHDKLYAKALALNNGKNTVLIISVNVVGLFKPFLDDIRKEISKANKIPVDNILISCTHNHNGPDTMGLWNKNETKTGVDLSYMKKLKLDLIDVGNNALDSKQDAKLFLSTIDAKGISYNARECDGGINDTALTILQATDLNDKNIVTLVNFACHPEVLNSKNTLITADYPYFMCRKLDDTLKGNIMMVSADLGGMLTPKVKEHTFSEAKRIGESLADYVLKALADKTPIVSNKLTGVCT
jgi:hypothetical protein